MRFNTEIFFIIIFALFITQISLIHIAAEENTNDLFQEVQHLDNSIVITFLDHGVRYSIELNGKGLGINKYNQILTLNPDDILGLIHKHGAYEIRPVFEKNRIGLNIKSYFYWGDKKTEKNYFIEAK